MSAGRFSVEAIFKSVDRFSAPIAKMQSRADKFAKGLSRGIGETNKVVDKVAGGLGTAAMGLGAAGLAAGAALLSVGKTGADFEQTITNVGAVMGKSRGQIGELEKEAMRLGVVTQFSSSEVAEAMEMMARKGFDSKEILAGIPGVLNAVAASGEGMAEVATVVGSAIRGFGLDASKTSHVADLLAFSAEKTGARITEMGEALSIAAPTAKTLGVSIEDTAAAVGLLQKMGIDASTAGTATATMLAKITKPSKDAAEQMAHLGIAFKDAKGNALPFRDILGQFVKAGDKAGGNMNRMAFFAELVGLRGDKAAIALSDMAKSGDFDKLANGLKNVDGYSEKVAKIRLDTTMGSWKLLTSTIEVLETKVFNLKSGAIRGVIDQTNAWVAANQDLIVQKVEDTISKVANNLPQIETWLKRVGIALAVFTAFAVAVKVAAVASAGFELAVGAAALAGTAFSAVMGIVRAVMASDAIATAASTVAYWARNTALAIGEAGTASFTGATIASTVATAATTAATWLKTAAVTAYTAVTEGATAVVGALNVMMTEGVAATVASTIAFAPFLATVLTVTAAVAALVAVYENWKSLNAESEGLGISGTIGEMVKRGTLNPFEAINGFQDDQARERAGQHSGDNDPQMVSPQARNASYGTGEVTIRDETGRASVTKAPKSGFKMPLVPASGTL